MEKVTAKDLEKLAEEIGYKTPRGLVCCLCGDEPQRASLKGELFCKECFEDVYL